MHNILRVTHQAGKLRLLALLSLLSTCVHQASVVILLSSRRSQQQLLQSVQAVSNDIRHIWADTAAESVSALAADAQDYTNDNPQQQHPSLPHWDYMHAEALTLSCGSIVVAVRVASPSHTPTSNAPGPNPKFVFIVADHDLCTADSHLRRFWGHLHEQQQQPQQHMQEQQQQQINQPAATLLNTAFGHLGWLWRMVSTTYSLPGLASTLTDLPELGFSTHHIQTALPADCIAHPMMLPADLDMHEIQRRVVPPAAATVLQLKQSNEGNFTSPWYARRPGLLQWLATLNEAAAAGNVQSFDSKLMLVVARAGMDANELLSHVDASASLSVAILQADIPSHPGMLATTSDCFLPVINSLESSVLSMRDRQAYLNSFQRGQMAPRALLQSGLSACQMLETMTAALNAAQAQHEQPIHSIVFLSWESLQQEPLPQIGGQPVTDLYLCDMADTITRDSTAPLTQMAANALAMVSSQLCGVYDR